MIMTDLDYQSRQQGRLLVVDDDEDVRQMLVRLLDSEGYQAAEAASGEEVLASLNTRAPDLVVLDIMLSQENGFDVLTAIRRQSEVPVILLTGRDRESDRVLGLRLGADDYVVKPFSPAELAARIATVLRRTGQRRAVAQQRPYRLRHSPYRHDLPGGLDGGRTGRDHGQGVRPPHLSGLLPPPGVHPGAAARPGVGLVLGLAGRRHRDRAHPSHPTQDRDSTGPTSGSAPYGASATASNRPPESDSSQNSWSALYYPGPAAPLRLSRLRRRRFSAGTRRTVEGVTHPHGQLVRGEGFGEEVSGVGQRVPSHGS